jgi:DNA-3-methyladenine glycosylase
MSILGRDFYHRSALDVARGLLGCRLVRLQDGQRLSGLILETEAYQGEEDLGCHASAGKTPRTEVMYGRPGVAYVYFTYGMHWLLNAVTDAVGVPAAVLIRAVEPVEGKSLMAENRSHLAHKKGWTNGPAKLTQALAVDGDFNKRDLCDPDGALFIEAGDDIPESVVLRRPRVGLNSVPEPWKSIPWRFMVDKGGTHD